MQIHKDGEGEGHMDYITCEPDCIINDKVNTMKCCLGSKEMGDRLSAGGSQIGQAAL